MIKYDLLEYLKKEMGRGTSKETLLMSLKAGGWAEQDINDTFTEISKIKKPSPISIIKDESMHFGFGLIFKIIFILVATFLVVAYILGGQP